MSRERFQDAIRSVQSSSKLLCGAFQRERLPSLRGSLPPASRSRTTWPIAETVGMRAAWMKRRAASPRFTIATRLKLRRIDYAWRLTVLFPGRATVR